jgi:hypothetical protein
MWAIFEKANEVCFDLNVEQDIVDLCSCIKLTWQNLVQSSQHHINQN